MDLLSKVALGFHVAMAWPNFLAALAGVVLGTWVGFLPRLNAVTAVAMLLPVVRALDASQALILLAAVGYSAQHAGMSVAIRQGSVRGALAIALLASFFAGCVGVLVISLLALPLAELAFKFGAAENFSLLMLGLIGSVVMSSGSLVKAMAMAVLGVLLGQLGHDATSGVPRFLLEIPQLTPGVNFIALTIGVFGCGELIANLGWQSAHEPELMVPDIPEGQRPTRQDFIDAWPAALRGTALGAVLGLLPGGGALLASFVARSWEKRAAPALEPDRAARRGMASREAAASAGTRTGFVPMMVLGVPPNAALALLVGAMVIKGIPVGPVLMTAKPDLFWSLIVSMWIGNLLLLIVNLPLPGLWRRVSSVPYSWLCPLMLLLCCFGAYLGGDGGESRFNVYLMACAALMGYVFHKLDCEPAPLILGFVLSPMMDDSLRRALQLSDGDWGVLLHRPLSAGMLAVAVLSVAGVMLPTVRSKREAAFKQRA